MSVATSREAPEREGALRSRDLVGYKRGGDRRLRVISRRERSGEVERPGRLTRVYPKEIYGLDTPESERRTRGRQADLREGEVYLDWLKDPGDRWVIITGGRLTEGFTLREIDRRECPLEEDRDTEAPAD